MPDSVAAGGGRGVGTGDGPVDGFVGVPGEGPGDEEERGGLVVEGLEGEGEGSGAVVGEGMNEGDGVPIATPELHWTTEPSACVTAPLRAAPIMHSSAALHVYS
jgi:hypothetical protein